MVIEAKERLRTQVRHIAQDDSVYEVKEKILSWSLYRDAKSLAFYLPMIDELSLEFLFDSEKQFFLPRYDHKSGRYEMALVKSKTDLVLGKYGIPEPGMQCRSAEKNEIGLWFIPGLAFSREGHRLGRGAGFYDRLLAGETGIKTGICSYRRVLENIPFEAHDIKMNFVLTDKEIIEIK